VNVLELREGILPAHEDFPNDTSTLILVFAPAGTDFNNFNDIIHYLHHYDKCFIAGCSGGGVIHESTVFDEEMVIVRMAMEWTKLHVCSVNTATSSSYDVGVQLAEMLNSSSLSGVLVFAGGEVVSGSALAAGINSVLNGAIPVIGALAGKINPDEQWTWTLDGTKIIATSVVGIGFYGSQFNIFTSMASGWQREGLWVEVTKSDGREILELNDRPALDVYSQYIGALEAAALPVSAYRHPLAILPKIMAVTANTCMVYGVDKEKRSLMTAAEIPEGSIVQFMQSSERQLIGGVEDSAILMGAAVDSQDPGFVFIVSSVGRRAMLGSQAAEEAVAIAQHIVSENIAGLYSIGELCPHLTNEVDYHSQTVMMAHLWELEP